MPASNSRVLLGSSASKPRTTWLAPGGSHTQEPSATTLAGPNGDATSATEPSSAGRTRWIVL